MTRYEHAGAASNTATLNADITAGSTTLTVNTGGGTGFPTGATAAFWIVVDVGTSIEEKILVGSRSGDSFTSLTRGQDNTSASAHQPGATVKHIFSAVEAEAANDHINTPSRDDHTQYAKKTGDALSGTFSGTPTFSGAVTFSGSVALGTGTYSGAAVFSGATKFTNGTLNFGVGANGATGGAVQIATSTGANAVVAAINSAADANLVLSTKGNGGLYFTNAAQSIIPMVIDTTTTSTVTITNGSFSGEIKMTGSQLPTTNTTGFFYLAQMGGTPTGVPSAPSGARAMCFDTNTNKLWVYNSGWKSVTLA